ncbi:MAG: polyphosphate kinase 2 family protein [Pseudorhodoplanes sp.]
MKLENIADRFRIDKPDSFRLADIDPRDTLGLEIEKEEGAALLKESIVRLSDLQDVLFAQDRWAVLAIFQALDAAGKDGVVKHVMSGVNPAGCQVYSFKAPTSQELDHDYLWRTTVSMPERGRIGIFNRSYYEEVLVVRGNAKVLAGQKLPPVLVTKDIWKQRFEDIRNFETYQARNGTLILKFFLHVSKEEQAKRLLERIDDPSKNWKFNPNDIAEREHFDDYLRFYEDVIRETSRPNAPWFVVPADRKWFTRLVVVSALIEAMEGLDLHYPKVDEAMKAELQKARAILTAELPAKNNKKNGKNKDNGKNKNNGS